MTAIAVPVPLLLCQECAKPFGIGVCVGCHNAGVGDAISETENECAAELREFKRQFTRAAQDWVMTRLALGRIDRATADVLTVCLDDLDEYLGL